MISALAIISYFENNPCKFTLQWANQKKKNYSEEKQNSPTLHGVSTYLPIN
jgi:hypothetical protein